MTRRLVGICLALLIATAGVWFQHHRLRDPHTTYGRFLLPAFDAWVYVAMAEAPAVFTLAPWGYRILTPAVVHALPIGSVNARFRYTTLGAVAACGVLLFGYFRRLGFARWLALCGVAVFVMSPPASDIIRYRFLVDPLTLALWIAFLWALEAGSGAGVLAVVAVLGALSKEMFLVVLPLVLAFPWRDSVRARFVRLALAAAPGVAVTLVLRLFWVPTPRSGGATWASWSFLSSGAREVVASAPEWIGPLMVGGLLPLAGLGLLVPRGRGYARLYAYLVVATLALPLAAAVYPGEGRVIDFYVADVTRLLAYALPWLLALVGHAVAAVVGADELPRPARAGSRTVEIAAAIAAVAIVVLVGVSLDRYRRFDLSGPREGPMVLATCRQSLRVAALLERGGAFEYDFRSQGFLWGESDPAEARDARWFVRGGFGSREETSSGPLVLREERGTLLVSAYAPRPIEVVLTLSAPAPVTLRVGVNDRPTGTISAAPDLQDVRLSLAPSALFRGDNVLVLRKEPQDPPVTILRLAIRPASS